MLRFVLALVLASAAAVLAAGAEEVPVHMTESTPLALQQHDESPRFAEAASEGEAEGEAEGESIYDEVVPHDVDHVEATPHVPGWRDGFVSYGVPAAVKAPWKAPSAWRAAVDKESAELGKMEEQELLKADTVMEESTNTMTLSARCLMGCANSYGLCTRGNGKGCACAAGCMCNRGEADATCAEHCHPDNHMNFVYGYHDADHFSPHFWGKTIGDTMTDYQHVRACLAGCARRGKCKPRFCPRHPSGGYKCSECKRLEVVPFTSRRGEKRYATVERVTKTAHLHHTVQHSHARVDAYGNVVRHTHTRHTYSLPTARFAETDAHVEMEAEAEADAEQQVDADAGMAVHMEEGSAQVVEADEAMSAAAESDAELEAQAQAEAEDGYVHVLHTPFVQSVTADASNIPRYAPRVVEEQFVRPVGGEDMADNGPVSAAKPQDRLAAQIDCNFYDCTGQQSEPYVPVGSLNPVQPYVWKRDTRTTTFSTVPDMLEPRAEHKTVIIA